MGTAQDEPGHGSVDAARDAFLKTIRFLVVMVLIAVAALAWVAAIVSSHLSSHVATRNLVTAALLLGTFTPVLLFAYARVVMSVHAADELADETRRQIDEQAARRDLEARLADALEMAEDEQEALRVIERGFAAVLPDHPAELLLADNSHAHLARRASVEPHGTAAACGVGSPQECPATRRARVHIFPDSEAVNACPKLAAREGERCAAVCMPVSVMGRAVGVVHSVQPFGTAIDETTIGDLQSLANQAGTRLGMLRIMAETHLQANTDGLTGLLNRRAFENRMVGLRSASSAASGAATIVMADLDHFKNINDTYGHETGDRALRLFAQTLRASVRDNDLVSRYGGEEFALIFPHCDLPDALHALERIRLELQAAVRTAGLPAFTASFGVTPGSLDEDLDVLLNRADQALFEAKRTGRDRIVTQDGTSATAPVPASSRALA